MLLICSAFSLLINAQTLYVKNTTNSCCLDVTNITKWGATCNGSAYCTMTDITGVGAGSSASQAYPTACASVTFITVTITY